ncbi:hypothetical protein BDA99DRAFT_607170 [Phascolomyces articulosus]|uniref:Uncharacterized protein n=1 Tax=Phascolomyces articulosus TaxID=60185 RepID=A0AAD5K4Q6_9FUNG|nr:hypothetical protein BDA99DRAFT_607170 [Phascolomyces articulosus]
MDNTNLRRCTGCKGNRPLEMFVANQETYNTCQRRRNRQSDVGKPLPKNFPHDELLTDIRTRIEAIDGYHYYQEFTPNPRKKLDRTFSCRINGLIDKPNAYVHLKIKHSIGHIARPPIDIYNVDDEIRLHIEETASQYILTRYPEQQALGVLTQPQVYYWWNCAFERQYKLDRVQFISTEMSIDRAITQGVQKVFTQVTSQYSGLGFVMPLFCTILQLSQMGEVEEVHVDSTFKTNRTGHEHFGIVATVNGVGVPFAYFLLKMTTTTTPLNNAH